MQKYRDQDGNVHCLDSAAFKYLLPAGCVEITDAEAAALLNPPLTLAEALAAKKAELAAVRYAREVGGVVLANGMKVATDDRSKALIAGARLSTLDDPEILTDWKAEAGWVQIDAATVAAIATAVAAHVRACFAAERTHCAALDALAADPATTAAEIEAYDLTTGWPN